MNSDNPSQTQAANSLPPAISQNIEALEQYYRREEQHVGTAQRLLERLSSGLGRPGFLALMLSFVTLWIVYNAAAPRLGWTSFDPPPFPGLQGLVTLAALLITTVVLIGQNRLARRANHREQMELQVNLLTEQKTTKLVHLIEELRHDLPMVRDRHDADAAELQRPTDAADILKALEEARGTAEKSGGK